MTTLADLEANYEDTVRRYEACPSIPRRIVLAKKQVLIDGMRREEKKTLRWFTSAELQELGDEADDWPTEPREPLALAVVSEPPKHGPQTVKWHTYTTLTLDSLITMLQELRKTRGGETPVVGVEFGGYSALHEVLEEEDCIVIE